MGNSRNSRYADGKDLYSADAETQRFLRGLAQRIERSRPGRLIPRVPPSLVEAARHASSPRPASPRRVGGEASRLLLDPVAGAKVRRLARRHRFDEGDVARLWARSLFSAPATGSPLPFALEEPA